MTNPRFFSSKKVVIPLFSRGVAACCSALVARCKRITRTFAGRYVFSPTHMSRSKTIKLFSPLRRRNSARLLLPFFESLLCSVIVLSRRVSKLCAVEAVKGGIIGKAAHLAGRSRALPTLNHSSCRHEPLDGHIFPQGRACGLTKDAVHL